jgi:calcineurin-like phosphoesterase family protein
MPATFLYSDPHFGHAGVCRFMRNDGVTKLRPWNTPEEMDEELIKRFNERVRIKDKCYFLGDVIINRRAFPTLARLNGDKVLIRGNHDIFTDDEYREYFRAIRGCHVLNGMILTHIPIHPESLGRFGVNIHGHLHSNRVMVNGEIDVRYHSVCVEATDFAPILFEDVIKKITAEGGHIGFKSGNGPTM